MKKIEKAKELLYQLVKDGVDGVEDADEWETLYIMAENLEKQQGCK